MAEKVILEEGEEELEVKMAFKEKPKDPDVHYLYKMIIDVRMRQMAIDHHMTLEQFKTSIFQALRTFEINY